MTRAFWICSPGHGEIRDVDLPEPGPDDVLVRTLHTGVSRGTETLVFRGGVPASQHDLMRAPFQEGNFPGPVKYGYLNVGVVEQGPAGFVGRTVFCLASGPSLTAEVCAKVRDLPTIAVNSPRSIVRSRLSTATTSLYRLVTSRNS